MKNDYQTSEWKEFPLEKFFDVDYGNKFDMNKMTESSDMNIAFVSRTATNNGVSAWVELVDGFSPYPAGCITIALGGSLGSAFVQPKQFYTGQNVAVLKDKQGGKVLTTEEKLFVAMLIKKECESRFIAFGRELNKHIKTDFTLRLPAVSEDEVDWELLAKISHGILNGIKVETNNSIRAFSDISTWKYFKVRN